MPFPKCKIHFNKSFGSCPRETTIEDPETGVEIPVIKNCNEKLPDTENFKINNMIKAGVTLNEVNTNIINNNNGINVKELENTVETIVKTSKKSKSNEVTNEDK